MTSTIFSNSTISTISTISAIFTYIVQQLDLSHIPNTSTTTSTMISTIFTISTISTMDIPPAIHETDELYNSQYLLSEHDITLEIIKNDLKSIEEEARWTQNILIPIFTISDPTQANISKKNLSHILILHQPFIFNYPVINYKYIIIFYEIACLSS